MDNAITGVNTYNCIDGIMVKIAKQLNREYVHIFADSWRTEFAFEYHDYKTDVDKTFILEDIL